MRDEGFLIQNGVLGKVLHFSGRYWTDYGCSAQAPMSWRYRGGPGSGALADVGSHLSYVAEFLAGDIVSVSGGRFSTAIAERPKPLGAVMGHDHVEVSDEYEAVENDDYAAYSAEFANGVGGLEVSRVAAGHANSLIFEVFCENGAARFDQRRPAEIELFLNDGASAQNGYRQVILGPEHPYIAGGLAMDAPSVGFGQNDAFAYQARAFLDEVAGLEQRAPPVRNLRRRRTQHGNPRGGRRLRPQPRKAGHAMKLGVYNAVLHDRSLPEALDVIKSLGLEGVEVNAGGFLPPVHIPIDDVINSQSARDDYLGIFADKGMILAGLNANGNPLHPDPVIGEQHSEDLRKAIKAAGALGQTRVVGR